MKMLSVICVCLYVLMYNIQEGVCTCPLLFMVRSEVNNVDMCFTQSLSTLILSQGLPPNLELTDCKPG